MLYTFSDHSRKYRVETEGGSIFLKWAVTAEGKNTMRREISHVRLLDSVGVSPQLLAASQEHLSYATEWVDGNDGSQLVDEKRLEIVDETIQRIRRIDCSEFEIRGWQNLFLFRTDPETPRFPNDMNSSLRTKLENAYFQVRELDGDASLHSDFHTGNLIFTGDRLYVIDPEHMQTGIASWDQVYYLGYDDAGMDPCKRARWLAQHIEKDELKLLLEFLLARGYTWALTAKDQDIRGNIVSRGRRNIELVTPVYEELFM